MEEPHSITAPISVQQRYMIAWRAIEECLNEPEIQRAISGVAQSVGQPADVVFKQFGNLPQKTQGSILWMINKAIDDPYCRIKLSTVLGRLLSDAETGLAPNYRCQIASSTREGEDLIEQGIVQIPDLLNRNKALEVLDYLTRCTERTELGKVFYHQTADVVRAPHLMNIAADNKLLSIVQQHLGAPAIVLSLAAWWSYTIDEISDVQVFHRDRDDFRACKLFLYLNDVGPNDGPHIFVKNSHKPDYVKQRLDAFSSNSVSFKALFSGNGRTIAQHIEPIFESDICELTGEAGTAFIENTYGFHRGKPPAGGKRCVFEITYGYLPYSQKLKSLQEGNLSSVPNDYADNALARFALSYVAN